MARLDERTALASVRVTNLQRLMLTLVYSDARPWWARFGATP